MNEWIAIDHDEFVVEDIVEHRGTGKSGDPLEFRICWSGYGSEDDTWIPFHEAKDG